MRHLLATVAIDFVVVAPDLHVRLAGQQLNPRRLPGAPITMYAPDQHDLYDGLFNVSAGSHLHGGNGCRIYPMANKRPRAR
jgi:hypothetical protein